MKCRFFRKHMDEFHVERMCQILGIFRSNYYAWCKRPLAQRKQDDAHILETIKRIHSESRKTYGSPRIHRQLRKNSVFCGKKQVERIMKRADIRAIHKRKYKITTNTEHTMPVAENKFAH